MKSIEGLAYSLVVHMEGDMVTSEERSPSEDCALDGEQFFELNVPTAMSTGNSGSKPIRLECTADPFGAAGISVDMQGRAFRASPASKLLYNYTANAGQL